MGGPPWPPLDWKKGNLSRHHRGAATEGRPRRGGHGGPPVHESHSRVIEKIGLRYLKDARFYDTDVRYYAITRKEYRPDDSKQD
jgi:hypothetical protein